MAVVRCPNHPSMHLLPHKDYCTLDEDWSDGIMYGIESDRRKFEYAYMSQGRFSTKGAYQRDLKRQGLTDDISVKELRKSDMGRRKREQVREESIRKLTDSTFKGFRYGNQPCSTPKQRYLRNRLEKVLKS